MYARCRPLVIGDAWILNSAKAVPGIPALTINPVSAVAQARFEPGTVDVLEVGAAAPPLSIGTVSPEAGEAAFRYVVKAIELAMAGEVDATVTNPLNKEALNAAGHHFAGPHRTVRRVYPHARL